MSVKERFKQHLKPSTIKQRETYKLYNAINKYGKEKFYVEVIETNIPEEEIDNREIYYIEKFDSFYNGYNSTKGGDTKTISSIQDIEALNKFVAEHKPIKEIALYFNVNKETVERTFRALNIKYYNKVEEQYLLTNKDNMTNVEIVKHYGVHPETVSRAFKKFDIKRGKGCSNKLNPQNQKKEKEQEYETNHI